MVSIIYVPHFRDKEVKAQTDCFFNRQRQDSALVSLTSESMVWTDLRFRATLLTSSLTILLEGSRAPCRSNGAPLGLGVVRGLGGESQQCLGVCLKAEPFCGVVDSNVLQVVLSIVLSEWLSMGKVGSVTLLLCWRERWPAALFLLCNLRMPSDGVR